MTQAQMMEMHNYWGDPRVQAAMFSTVWKVVWREGHTAIVSFDASWIIEEIYDGKVQALVDQWVEAAEPFTLGLEARAEAELDLVMISEAYAALEARAEAELGDVDLVMEAEGFKPYRPPNSDRPPYPYCLRVNTEYEVCGECRGSGKVVNPSIDCAGLTYEDFGQDPDFEEAYFRGDYDQTCPTCGGDRVVAIPKLPSALSKAIADYEEQAWDDIRTRCAEMRMGA